MMFFTEWLVSLSAAEQWLIFILIAVSVVWSIWSFLVWVSKTFNTPPTV